MKYIEGGSGAITGDDQGLDFLGLNEFDGISPDWNV